MSMATKFSSETIGSASAIRFDIRTARHKRSAGVEMGLRFAGVPHHGGGVTAALNTLATDTSEPDQINRSDRDWPQDRR